ncbi:DNA-binding transcriptional LysR family regulator [Chitinophaga skermanii]|uniref:DNA-binding transcriptional LysR family regulator n=1 Tax=Chitinophaga skermanii TaxID=331697 RepID=A0A327Q2U8_9BACT|nr:LysR family transcriptional regulator [Chitinophaga skermanii]RAI98679.1 DNA-binding transcriptional LysR family regulator [Chitinophaga skermanii]
MVNLEWYRTFKAIYTAGTLTGAAKELAITQPNVSQHLAALENYIGVELFERTARKMIATHYGKVLYTKIVGALETLESVENSFHKNIIKQQPTISIGAPREFFHAMVASRIAKSGFQINFQFGLTNDLLAKLEKSQLNFVFSNYAMDNSNFASEPIFTEKLVLVSSPKLNIQPFKKLVASGDSQKTENWLKQQKWLAYSSDLALIRRFWLINFQKRPAIQPSFIIPDLDTIAKAIATSKALSILPEYLVKSALKQKQLVKIWPGYAPVTNTLYLCYHKNQVTPAQLTAVHNLLKK